jgi:hypothetical protein
MVSSEMESASSAMKRLVVGLSILKLPLEMAYGTQQYIPHEVSPD